MCHLTLANCPPLKTFNTVPWHLSLSHSSPQTTCTRVGYLEYQNRWQEHSPDNPHEEGSPFCLQNLRMRSWPPSQYWRFTTVHVCIPTCIYAKFCFASRTTGRKKVILLSSFRKDKMSCRKTLRSAIIKDQFDFFGIPLMVLTHLRLSLVCVCWPRYIRECRICVIIQRWHSSHGCAISQWWKE